MLTLVSLFTVLVMALFHNVGAVQAQGPGAAAAPTPAWQAAPGVPGMEYAPQEGRDIFRHQGKNYYWWDGRYWHTGPSPQGPWRKTKYLPGDLYRLDATHFKNPPDFAKPRKPRGGSLPQSPERTKKPEEAAPPGPPPRPPRF
jgi:hypothetical protein